MPGVRRKPRARADHRGRHAARAQLGVFLSRDDGRALQRHALGQHDRVADLGARRRDEPVLGHLAQHGAGHDRPVEPVGDLGVAADERDLQLLARLAELGEERAHRVLVGAALGQQQRGEEPAGRAPRTSDVVGVDVQRVPAEVVGGERDRIGGGHQVAVADVDDRRVLADARPHDHARIAGRVLVEDGLQERRRGASRRAGTASRRVVYRLVPALHGRRPTDPHLARL